MQCCNAPYFLPAMFMSGWVKSYDLTLQRTSFPLYFDVLMFCHSSDSEPEDAGTGPGVR